MKKRGRLLTTARAKLRYEGLALTRSINKRPSHAWQNGHACKTERFHTSCTLATGTMWRLADCNVMNRTRPNEMKRAALNGAGVA